MPLSNRNCSTCSVRGPQSFCSLSAESLAALQEIGTHIALPARAALFTEGYSANHVYAICHGRIKLSASSADGRLLLLRIARAGDVIGLASVLKSGRHTITAETLEPCAVKSIQREAFFDFMKRHSDVSQNTLSSMAYEFNSALLSARRLALSSSAAGKLAGALLDWADGEPQVTDSFVMPLSHEELGSMSGLTRETVTRLLSRFKHEGLIRQAGARMTVLNRPALEALHA